MKTILPFENILYKSSLSQDEAYNRLTDIINTEYTYTGGWINNTTFKISRNISCRNSFLPEIKGEFCKDTEETLIRVRMRLHLVVQIISGFWLIFVFFFCIIVLTSEFQKETLIPFAMLLFGIVMIIGSFKSESRKSIKDLSRIFEAEIIE